MNRAKAALTLASVLLLLLCAIPASATTIVTVTTDKPTYSPGDTLVVSGTVSPVVAGQDVAIAVYGPQGELRAVEQVTPAADGTYSKAVLTFSPTDPLGTWTVRATYMGVSDAKTFTLAAKAVVRGKVVDTKGAPIVGATVTVGPAYATTGADGTFEASLATEGTYAIRVEKAGYYAYSGTVSAKAGVNDIGTITLTSYEEKISELESRIASLEKFIGDLQKSVSDLTAKVSSLASTVEGLSSALDSVKKDLESAKSDIKDLRATVAIATDLKKSVEALTSTVDGLKKSVDVLQAMATQLPILYALALIGIIIAIVAIVQVYRKIAK
jgi:prefoldin subunit 5